MEQILEHQGFLMVGGAVSSLHETPEGGWMMCGDKTTIDLSVLQKSARKRTIELAPMYPINRTAMELLKLCNGTSNNKEIFAKMASEFDCSLDDVKNAIEPFVKRALKLKHLQVSPCKDPKNKTVSGSREYYFPIHMSIELTSRCNFKCKYCYRSAEVASSDNQTQFTLPGQEILQILGKMSKGGVSVIELTGGEPLLHPDILEIIDYCGKNFTLCALLTNGTYVTEEIAQALENAGNFLIGISLDGPNEEIVDELAGYRGAYKKICNSFRILAEHNLLARAGMTVIPENIDYIEDTLLLAKECRVSAFTASTIMMMGRASEMELKQEHLCRFVRNMAELSEKYPDILLQTGAKGKEFAEKRGNCGAGYQGFAIGPNGDVRACLVNCQKWSVIGNLLSEDYETVFSSPKIKRFRNLRWPQPEDCGDCEMAWYCGNCAMRGIETALTKKPDCKWAKEQNVWDWVLPEEATEEYKTCRRSQPL